MTGDVDVNLAAVIHNLDDDGMYVWLNQQTWTGSEWVRTAWYNEEVGIPQYTYSDLLPTTSLLGLKMRMQDKPDLTNLDIPRGIEMSSLSWDVRYSTGNEEQYCEENDNPDWDKCEQANTIHVYSSYLRPEIIPERDAPTFNLPYRNPNSVDNPSYLEGGFD